MPPEPYDPFLSYRVLLSYCLQQTNPRSTLFLWKIEKQLWKMADGRPRAMLHPLTSRQGDNNTEMVL
jgi:hypothetical protein